MPTIHIISQIVPKREDSPGKELDEDDDGLPTIPYTL